MKKEYLPALGSSIPVFKDIYEIDITKDGIDWSLNGNERLELIDEHLLTLNVLHELCRPREEMQGAAIRPLTPQEEAGAEIVMQIVTYLRRAPEIDWAWYNKQIMKIAVMENPELLKA